MHHLAERSFDVVIVGGGIIGCALAFELATTSAMKVGLFERGTVGREQSSRAWGLIRQQGRHPAEIPLAADALARWPGLAERLGAPTDFVRSGILVAAENDAERSRLETSEKIAREYGVKSRMIERAEIRALIPDADLVWPCGLYTEEDGHAEPERACKAFEQAARAKGVTITEHCPVTAIEVSAGQVSGVRSAQGFVRAPIVVCAAGVGSADILRTAGIDLPLQSVRSSVGRTHPAQAGSSVAVWSSKVAFRPRSDGSYNFSNGYHALDSEYDLSLRSLRDFGKFMPNFVKNRSTLKLRFGEESFRHLRRELTPGGVFQEMPEPRPNSAWIDSNFECLCEVFPRLRKIGIAKRWGGRIDVTPDLIPVIGAVKQLPGLIIAAGFSAHGLSISPTVASLVARLINGGKADRVLHSFRFERFADNDYGVSENALV